MDIGRWGIATLVAILVLCSAAAGCFGVKTPPVSRPAAPAVFVDYHRTGGIAGFDDRLVIFDNGAAIVSTKTISKEIVLNTTEKETISRLFEQVQYSQLQANYPARYSGADLLQYSISFQSKTVTLEESAYPSSVQLVIDELDRIVKKAAA
jgi:hypothetical protein